MNETKNAALYAVKSKNLNPEERSKTFEEVALGYDEEQAAEEARRCLGCKNPACVEGCPVHVDIPHFIAAVKRSEFDKAYSLITADNALPAVTGRVCPQEKQCECRCVRGVKGEPVSIGLLERFVADYHAGKLAGGGSEEKKCAYNAINEQNQGENRAQSAEKKNMKVAVIGSGPSGLAAAGELCSRGYEVTVFEALHKAGGVLAYGIPEFRLPKKVVNGEVERLKEKGVKFVLNAVAGKSFTLNDLKNDGYKAIFLGTGAGLPSFMNIEGEDLAGVFAANEFLTRINLMEAFKPGSSTPVVKGGKAIIVGGGNVAMDAARSALRLGSDVTLVYRRTEKELPARRAEYEHAVEEGVKFAFLTNPIAFLGENGRVTAVKLQKMKLSEPDASGRARPIPEEGADFILPCDYAVMAIGTSPNPLIKNATPELEVGARGTVTVNEESATSIPFVYAGGDAVSGAATVILAMGAGKKAAKAIDEKLSECSADNEK